MSNLFKYIGFFLILAAASVNAFAKVQVFAQVDTSKDIYAGEPFTYLIIINGEQQPGQPDLTPLKQYNPRFTGNRDLSKTSINIVNGRTQRTVINRVVMTYSMIAHQPGPIKLPPVKVKVKDRTYETNHIVLNILRPGTTDQLGLEVELSEKQCYVGQPVIMTVNFYVYGDIGNFRFNIPVFDSEDFYLEDPDISGAKVKEYDIGIGTTVFVEQKIVNKNGKKANLITFSKILIPKYPGKTTLMPTTVSADVVVGEKKRSNDFFEGFFEPKKMYKRFMVAADQIELDVLSLPQENKPADFYGLVGKYNIIASATPTNVNVGDPITLTIMIGPGKYLKPVQWPKLESIPKMTEDFKIPIQKSSPSVANGFKTFTQTIRAKNDKVTEIPQIPLSFFDADKGQYVTINTEPIKIKVASTKILTTSDLQGRDFTPVNKEVELIKKGISANYESLDALENKSFSPFAAMLTATYLALWALPLALFITTASIKIATHTTPEKTAKKRRRQAAAKTITELKKIAPAQTQQKHELLIAAMKQYIGQRFDKVAGSLTSDDCRQTIIINTDHENLADNYKTIIDDCEVAHYTSAQLDIDWQIINQVVDLIENIEKNSKK